MAYRGRNPSGVRKEAGCGRPDAEACRSIASRSAEPDRAGSSTTWPRRSPTSRSLGRVRRDSRAESERRPWDRRQPGKRAKTAQSSIRTVALAGASVISARIRETPARIEAGGRLASGDEPRRPRSATGRAVGRPSRTGRSATASPSDPDSRLTGSNALLRRSAGGDHSSRLRPPHPHRSGTHLRTAAGSPTGSVRLRGL